MINDQRIKKVVSILNDSASLHKKIQGYYDDIITHLSSKPLQLIIEMECFFFHLMQGINNEDDEVFNRNLDKSKGHIEVLALDTLKLLWIEIDKDLKHLVDNKSIKFEEYLKFKDISRESRKLEIDNLGKEKTIVLDSYINTIEHGRLIIKKVID
ncbi:MAG: hypothetical protein HQK91_04545 [Nitrospirae bacterium]|nr:hypothetical protein [Nitrospirota bacterium]